VREETRRRKEETIARSGGAASVRPCVGILAELSAEKLTRACSLKSNIDRDDCGGDDDDVGQMKANTKKWSQPPPAEPACLRARNKKKEETKGDLGFASRRGEVSVFPLREDATDPGPRHPLPVRPVRPVLAPVKLGTRALLAGATFSLERP